MTQTGDFLPAQLQDCGRFCISRTVGRFKPDRLLCPESLMGGIER